MLRFGQPAISIPARWTASALPVGIQIVGRRLEYTLVLRVAAAFETLRPWAVRRPCDAVSAHVG
jgi:aspartyl-tRNA(Asn)/glutamyl-tRNA(Gln) amidotransferase subunit A